jgi:hypothetical protein
MRAGNQNQVPAIEFAPATYVAISQFNEINGPVKLVLPTAGGLDLFLAGINLHKRQLEKQQGRVRLANRVASLHCVGQTRRVRRQAEKGAHVQIEGELRYREYKKDRGSDADAMPIKRRLAEIHANRVLKLDRAAKQDEPAPESDAPDFPVDQPAA